LIVVCCLLFVVECCLWKKTKIKQQTATRIPPDFQGLLTLNQGDRIRVDGQDMTDDTVVLLGIRLRDGRRGSFPSSVVRKVSRYHHLIIIVPIINRHRHQCHHHHRHDQS